MLILLEGPDGGGKTTLATELARRITGVTDIRHCSQLRRDPLDEYIGDLHMYLPGTGMNIIYDRHYMGELIYGPLYRDVSAVTPGIQFGIEQFLNHKGALLVLVTNHTDVLRQRCAEKGEDFLQVDDIYFVRMQYYEEFEESKIKFKKVVIDATSDDVDDIIWLANKIEKRVAV
jgi:thymidylate kinase